MKKDLPKERVMQSVRQKKLASVRLRRLRNLHSKFCELMRIKRGYLNIESHKVLGKGAQKYPRHLLQLRK